MAAGWQVGNQSNIFFLMVLALRPRGLCVFEICCEYQTSDLPGCLRFNARYALRQLSYMA